MSEVSIEKCVECSGTDLKTVKKDIKLERPNPGAIKVRSQSCIECQNCGEVYFDEEQAVAVGRAVDAQLAKN